MFNVTLPPGADSIRVLAVNGKRGKPPCIWQGPAKIEQEVIEETISRDPRVRQWLVRNRLIHEGVATLNLQIECFSQGRQVETYNVPDVAILLHRRSKRRPVSDAAVLRAFDMTENVVGLYRELLEERDTVIGRLVERGMKLPEQPRAEEAPAAAPPKDFLTDILERGSQVISLTKMLRELKDQN